MKKPGEFPTLQCTTGGFVLSSSYMNGIRQMSGKGLEWLFYYYSTSDSNYASSVKGRFIAPKDSSTFYLQMSNLKAEDIAMYHCARYTAKGSDRELRQKPLAAVVGDLPGEGSSRATGCRGHRADAAQTGAGKDRPLAF